MQQAMEIYIFNENDRFSQTKNIFATCNNICRVELFYNMEKKPLKL